MTYLAPRQGRFAVVMLISFCLQLVFFVLTCERSYLKHETAFVEHLSTQLQQELKLPLSVDDRVSLAVIANRYQHDERLAYIGVYNASDELILPIGESQQASIDQNKIIVLGDNERVLGSFVVEPKAVSRARIIGEHWLFLLGILMLHAMIWMIYGYIARPTVKLQQEIAKDVRNRLLAQGVIDEPAKPEPSSVPTKETLVKPTHTNQEMNIDVNRMLYELTKTGTTTKASPIPSSPTQKDEVVSEISVVLAFTDKYNLVEMLVEDVARDHFIFCDELLQKSLKILLAMPSLAGVAVVGVERFSKTGAVVHLSKTKANAKLSLAAVLLSKLMLDCHKSIYDKHRELGWFVLPLKTAVCDGDKPAIAKKLLQKHHQELLLLLDDSKLDELTGYVALAKLETDGTGAITNLSVYEKQCKVVKITNDTTAQHLDELKKAVLT